MQGVVQEALSMKRFGIEQERFPYLKALNGVQSVACFVWAALLMAATSRRKDAVLPPFWAFWKPGVTNSIGPACGFEALKSISYPAQVSQAMQPKLLLNTGYRLESVRYCPLRE